MPAAGFNGTVAPLSAYGLDSAYTGSFNISNADVTTLLTSNPSDFVAPLAVAINTAIVADPIVQWINTNGGIWTDAANESANWATSSVPISTDDVVIGILGSSEYTVTIPGSASAFAASLTVSSTNATVLDQGTLTLTGILTLAAGEFDLASGGTIVGGVLQATGGSFTWGAGTLSGVTYDGTLDLSPNNSTVYIANSLTANNLAGTGPGTINLTGISDNIYFEGNQTFNNATINLGNTSGYYDTIYNYDTNNAGSVLTLGPNVIVNQAINETAGYAQLTSAGSNHTGDGIVNEGTINAEAVNGTFYIEPYNFTNAGTINVANGDKLYIEPSVGLTNAGTITMAAGTTLTLGSSNTTALSNTGLISGTDDTVNIYSFGSFSNTGTFNVTNSTINLYGSYTTALLALFDNRNDTITIDGTLTNTGQTLTVGLGSALGTVVLASGGTIVGGTIVDQGSGMSFQSGTLSGVTYDGTLDLSPNNSTVYIANSLTANNLAGTGPGTINLTGISDNIYFEGNQTFNNATINLGNTSGYYDTIYNYDTNNAGSVLTLGPNVIVNQAINETAGYAQLTSAGSDHTGDGIVNEGTINAEAVNGTFYIEPYNFTNAGTINVANGDKLYIEPSVGLTNAGTITMAAGTTLTLGSSNTTALSNTGLISGTDDTVNIYSFGSFSNTGTFNVTNSTINLYGSYTTALLALFDNRNDTITIDGTLTNTGQTLTVGLGSALGTVVLASGGTIVGGTIVDQGSGVSFQSGTLSGVTYDGTLDLSPNNSTVYIANSLTANNLAGTGPGTINLTGISDNIYFEGNQTFNNATINLGNTSGYYDTIYNYDTNNAGSVLTLGPNVIVNQAINETAGYAQLTSAGSNHTGDGIVNEGTINAEAVNGTFYIEPYNFTNAGTINVANGDKLYIEPSVGLTNAGTITMAAGTTLTLGSSNTTALSNTGLISGTDDTVNIYSFGSFSNTGTFNVTNSTINLYGSYTTALLALFDNRNDTITIDGTLTNTGQTLTVGLGSALGTVVLASGGTIVGGTIVDQGSGMSFQSGTLSGVTYDGTLDLSPNNSTVYIANSLTANNLAGTGPGTINLTGISDNIYFEGNQTFNNATINLGNTSGYYDTIYNYDTNNAGSVLTLGPNVIVNQAINETAGYAQLTSAGSDHTGDGIVNEGTINAEAVNGTFYIEPYNFTNAGTINVANGDKLYIEPTTFTNNGTIAHQRRHGRYHHLYLRYWERHHQRGNTGARCIKCSDRDVHGTDWDA